MAKRLSYTQLTMVRFHVRPHMNHRAIIIHGWGASPTDHWFPWLAHELESRGFFITVPAMPDTEHPNMDVWIAAIAAAAGVPDEGLFLIGHSIGTVAILRYLESLTPEAHIGGTLLVAGFLDNIDPELDSFFRSPFDYARIKQACSNIIAIESDNDPAVPQGSGALLRDRLSAHLVTLHDAGHMNAEDGYITLPEVLDGALSFIE